MTKKVPRTRSTNQIDKIKALSRVAIMRSRGVVQTLSADIKPSLDQINRIYAKKALALAQVSTGLPNAKRSPICMPQ